MSPTLQSAIAERDAAIRVAMESQITVSRLQEQVNKLEIRANSDPNDRKLAELSTEVMRLRDTLGIPRIGGDNDVKDRKSRRLDTAEDSYQRRSQEIDSLRKSIEDMRMSLMKNSNLIGKKTSD